MNYYYQTFAQRMGLQPADVIIAPKSKLGIVDHYLTYLGVNDYGQEIYIENDYRNGVQAVDGIYFANKNPFASVRKFQGNETERYWAVKRAISLIGAKYDLRHFNCENFANFVQYGQSFSTQVNTADSMFVSWLFLGAATGIQRTFS